ncbi:MAG: hypothetical protein J07HQW2_00635 [Haloquadratum walsbyi J07HQW2]|uniref:Uncharacterized protein n=1 Tax=Haloquadratum walsbyi J07HQW2 TaxID=1238425 RepID=U1PPH1_9EURY|nr:MAG: hypothetical protein J07HQW2_00635 [Haloquadratum walsbyi J07HQW2]
MDKSSVDGIRDRTPKFSGVLCTTVFQWISLFHCIRWEPLPDIPMFGSSLSTIRDLRSTVLVTSRAK